uniref:(northern house mosquito) hypothetical protein n=1 Tax=Culex pipiens TaxID=7175 RepID=A0A8D8N7V5_CULPI
MYAALISVRASVGRLLAILALRLAGFVATERGLNFASRLVQLRIVHVDVELFGDLSGQIVNVDLLLVALSLLVRFGFGFRLFSGHVSPEACLDPGGSLCQFFVVGIELSLQLRLGRFPLGFRRVLLLPRLATVDVPLLHRGSLAHLVASERCLDLSSGRFDLSCY